MRSSARLRRVDRRPLPAPVESELRLVCFLRNEALRLPAFLRHYREMGVSRFLFVDNDSTDETVDLLLREPDCHVWRTKEHYGQRATWRDILLRRHACRGWCLIADVDEFLVNPIPGQPLLETCRRLQARGYDCLPCLMLDMFSEGALDSSAYRAGQDPLEVSPWCDLESIYEIDRPAWFPRCSGHIPRIPFGGVRERVFGCQDICLSKIVLVRFTPRLFMGEAHTIEGAALPDMRGLLLHFKFLHDFAPRAVEEAGRGQHYDGASQYKRYAASVQTGWDRTLWREGCRLLSWGAPLASPLVFTPDWFRGESDRMGGG